jgi:cell wall-associated NlpC family hydrolase
VVDIGEPEESPAVSAAASTTAADTSTTGMSEGNENFAPSSVTAQVNGKDPRMDDVVSLLGEYMPSDPSSTMAPYLSGFMSLRLLFLRPSRTAEEADLARTMLDSFSSYSAGGRSRSDIAVMLARDFMFLSQQQQQLYVAHAAQPVAQHNGFLGLGGQQHQINAPVPSGMSLFGLPITTTSIQNSPALTPIPMPGTADSMSIVSN